MDNSGSTPRPDPRQGDGAVPSAGNIEHPAGTPSPPSADPTTAGLPSATIDGPSSDETAVVGLPIQPAVSGSGGGPLFGYLAVYSLLRFGLVVVLTAGLSLFMPLIVALMFAIIVQLPLAWLLFARPRRLVNEAIAQASAVRRAERARLQSALTGDVDPE